eukprot:5210780-Lingulodinium_polyedra.AAC.2
MPLFHCPGQARHNGTLPVQVGVCQDQGGHVQLVLEQGPEGSQVALGAVLCPFLAAGGLLGQDLQLELAGGRLVREVAQVDAQEEQGKESLGPLGFPKPPAVQPTHPAGQSQARTFEGKGSLAPELLQDLLGKACCVEPLLLASLLGDGRQEALQQRVGSRGPLGELLGCLLCLPPPLGTVVGPEVDGEDQAPQEDTVPAASCGVSGLKVVPDPVRRVVEEDQPGFHLVQQPHAGRPSLCILVNAQAECPAQVHKGDLRRGTAGGGCSSLAALGHQVLSRWGLCQVGCQPLSSGHLKEVLQSAQPLVAGKPVDLWQLLGLGCTLGLRLAEELDSLGPPAGRAVDTALLPELVLQVGGWRLLAGRF